MEIAVLADAHGNADALRRAVDALADRVDHFIFAGDAFSDHRFSNECIEILRACGATCVAGNHELGFLSPAGARARQAHHVDQSLVAWVGDWPVRSTLSIGGRSIELFHSTPVAPFHRYVTPDSPSFTEFASLSCDLAVVGHAHQRFVAASGSVLAVNPGSIGRDDDPGAPGVLTCAVVDLATLDVEPLDLPA